MSAHILLDARKLGDGGIGVYLDTLITGLSKIVDEGGADLQLTLLVPPANQIHLPSDLATLERWRSMWTCVEEPAGKYSFAEYFLLARKHRALLKEVDLFHSPHFTLPFFLGVPSVVTIHDVIHLKLIRSFFKRVVARGLIRSALKRAEKVITVSKHSYSELKQEFPAHLPQVFVVPNAIQNDIRACSDNEVQAFMLRHQLSKPYCLYVGSDRYHKGFDLILDALETISARDDSLYRELSLVVVGEKFSKRVLRKLERRELRDKIRFFGAVSAADLSLLYSGANALIISSLEEGFGLPALEALACGTQIVSTPLDSIKEFCGESANFADGFNGEAIADILIELLEQDEISNRQERIANGQKIVQFFDCTRQALQTCAVYDSILGGKGTVTRDSESWKEQVARELAAEQEAVG